MAAVGNPISIEEQSALEECGEQQLEHEQRVVPVKMS